jgi:hypothetical protein
LLPEGFYQALHRIRDITLRSGCTGISLHGYQVNHSLEIVRGPNRYLQRDAAAAEPGLDFFYHPGKIGVFAVHLVNEDKPWQVVFLKVRPYLPRTNLNTGGSTDNNDGAFAHTQAGPHFTDEVRIAGGINQVDLLTQPLVGQHAQADADITLLFGRVVVGGGTAVIYPAQPVDYLGSEEYCFRQRCLAGTVVGQQRQVADILRSEISHLIALPL